MTAEVKSFPARAHECDLDGDACPHGRCWSCCDQPPCTSPAPEKPPSEVVGAMGAGLAEPPHYRRAEDRARFNAQARAWEAFRKAKRRGEDDATALAGALDVYHEQITLIALRRYTRGARS